MGRVTDEQIAEWRGVLEAAEVPSGDEICDALEAERNAAAKWEKISHDLGKDVMGWFFKANTSSTQSTRRLERLGKLRAEWRGLRAELEGLRGDVRHAEQAYEAERTKVGVAKNSFDAILTDRYQRHHKYRRSAERLIRTLLRSRRVAIDQARYNLAGVDAVEARLAKVREVALNDRKCPCCSGCEAIIQIIDGDSA